MQKDQERLLTEAKLVMIRRMPYYGTFIVGTEISEDRSIPTAATDFTSIKVNPAWLLGGEEGKSLRPRDEVVFVLAHEVLHMSFKHGLRMGFRDPALWNVAADYAINLILHGGGGDDSVGKMPEPDTSKGEVKLLDPKYKDMSAETIYDLLEKERKKQGGGQKLKINGVVIDLSKQDPGGTGGFTRPVNADGSGLTKSQQQALERDIDTKTSSSAAAAKMRGKLPAGLERLLKTAMTPIVDWRDRLRQFVAKQFPSEYSWQRPRRKFLCVNDLYLPYVEKTGVGKILFIMDTSGSVDYSGTQSEGAQYYAEGKAIHEDVCPEQLHVMYCDAEVAGHDVFEPGEEFILKPRGGGGTDFRPPFAKVEKDDINIQCAIYLTDGYGAFPDKPMPYPVLWVITTDVKPPWGEHIKLSKHN